MATTTARLSSANALVTDNGEPWVNPANAYATNGSTANSSLSANNGDVHAWTDFGFDAEIGPGDTINGITLVSNGTGDFNRLDITYQVYSGGAQVGTAKVIRHYEVYQSPTLGGAADMWGTTLTAADVRSSGFGFTIQKTPDRFSRMLLDSFTVVIDYTPGAGGSTVTGTGAISTPIATLSGSGSVTGATTGTGAITSPTPTLSGAGSVASTSTGAGAVSTPVVALSGSGKIEKTASGAITAPTPSLSGSGSVQGAASGTGAIQAPSPALSGAGAVQKTGSGAIITPAPALNGTGAIDGAIIGSGGHQRPSAKPKRFWPSRSRSGGGNHNASPGPKRIWNWWNRTRWMAQGPTLRTRTFDLLR